MGKNVLICHGGGPTAVLNASLYGALREAMMTPGVDHIYGAIGGTGGLVMDEPKLYDLRRLEKKQIDLLPYTPSTVIGSGRLLMNEEYFQRICNVIRENNIGYVIMNGGNGTMRMVAELSRRLEGDGVRVMGIPKTVDNDLFGTDHTPGFASCASLAAILTQGISMDTRSGPLHVMVVEVMGRDAGWLTASTAMARNMPGAGPHLIYTPENPVSVEKMMSDIDNKLCGRPGGIVVAVGEGIKNEKGEPFCPPIETPNGDVLYGGMANHVASLIVQNLHIQGRPERIGMMARADYRASALDRAEAIDMGRLAMLCAAKGHTGMVVGWDRVSNNPYKVEPILTPAASVAGRNKTIPADWFNDEKNDVNEKFFDYMRPLMDMLPPQMARPLTPEVVGEPEFIIPGR
ncbi:MAG: diphosphate--fructose-6-phosphate 1-phosphotransferase [Clostridia bacterium]|nr:diphosphate--fructose-6-phosphate 1-phosphotransferase [Clostridia bacterium]